MLSSKRVSGWSGVLAAGVVLAAAQGFAPTRRAQPAGSGARAARPPLNFAPVGDRFVARGARFGLSVSATQVEMRLPNSREALTLSLHGARRNARLRGTDTLRGRVNYLVGKDRSRWQTGIPTYARVRGEDVYPGIDVVYYGAASLPHSAGTGELEYDLVVRPHANPAQIRLGFAGARAARLAADGSLVLETGTGTVRQLAPVAYQERDGRREPVHVAYALRPANEIGFELGRYDRSRPLVVDPVVTFSTYLGGSGADRGYGIGADEAGNVYVAGETASLDFPLAGAFQDSRGGGVDAFITKYTPDGGELLYSTYFGGSGFDRALGLAVTPSGGATITGETASPDLPVENAVQAAYGGGVSDAFVARLDPSGSSLIFSTYLGGSGFDRALGLALDADGETVAVGETASSNFPTQNPLLAAYQGGGSDAFVTRLGAQGSTLAYSTYLGGSGFDRAYGVGVSVNGQAVVAGETASINFPLQGAFQPGYGGGAADAFVSRLTAAGDGLVYSTYLGGSGFDRALGAAVDPNGAAYAVGETASPDLPVLNALQPEYRGGASDGFAARLRPDGTGLIYSTYLGGQAFDRALGVTADATGRAYVVGETNSQNFVVATPLREGYGGGSSDGFLTRLGATGRTVVFSSYLGGSGFDRALAVAQDDICNVYVAGETVSTNFPTEAPQQEANAGQADVFTLKISDLPTDSGKLKFSPKKLNFGKTRVGETRERVLRIRNRSRDTLTLCLDRATGPFRAISSGGAVVLPARDEMTVTVEFLPRSSGAFRGALRILSSDSRRPVATVPLSGSAKPGR